ncbi:pentapeptide repeat-containing protein [Streptomyces stackebrandtii]|uniref:pentapeptide repeat-containing protein n=1 Tax=Streptomyces stackebrandtii TaxID=3051177 RepID=UPI0028DC67A0|nr:pentapeptide repeat-containing protein [Streptomyces sp. DSM 40976]
MSTSESPTWPRCEHGAAPAADPVTCRGIQAPGHNACLAHLADADRDAYLDSLTPGTDIDHRGTPFTEPLLNALLNALRDPATGHARLGTAKFESATFQGDAEFESATFQGDARFESATFQGDARFESATFQGGARFGSATFEDGAGFGSATFEDRAWFGSAIFQGRAWFASAIFQGLAGFGSATFEDGAWFGSAIFQGRAWFASAVFQGLAWFGSATFEDGAWFKSATFQGGAWFESATFQHDAEFGSATFQHDAEFGSATFKGDAGFESVVFERWVSLGPLVCAGRVQLSGAVFNGPTTLSFAARRLECRRTRWLSTADVRLRYASVDFAHAVFEYPLTIAAEADPFVLPDGQAMAEQDLAGTPDAAVRLASLRGVDAAHLVLADVDLSRCLFVGTVHLDQIRLEGACTFDTTPSALQWRGWRPVRFTPRRTLAEEHHWRASQAGAAIGWNVAGLGTGRVGPLQLAPVYRALRKAFEDGKHEPGAADFYYGEMEMRRHADDIPRSERSLLTGYWALSGYGMRASRALGSLAATMLITLGLLMGFGLPKEDPKQEASGTVPPGGGKVTFEIEKGDPQNPTGNRFTGKRFEKALNVTLNSVVFRSSGQDLTTAGTYIEMTSRLVEPALLALAVLAVRGRLKR